MPWQPPSTLGHTTKKRSVSIGLPGPTMSFHHPASRWPGPAGPAAWLSPVSACSTSTALSRAASSVPQVSYATVTGSRRPPASSTCERDSNSVANWRRPGGSPSRHAPVTGTIDAGVMRPSRYAPFAARKPGLEVGEDVVERLDADREPHEVRA